MRKASKRGRPLKFGRPSRVVALTLPDDVVRTLRGIDSDLGRAIVSLASPSRTARLRGLKRPIELSPRTEKEALIVVDPATLSRLPGCSLMRVAPDRALIVLESHQTPADLEIIVMDRLATRDAPPEERAALRTLSRALRKWRRDQRVKVSQRSILVLQGPA